MPSQLRALCQTFLARFFESESTASRGDLRESFFWIVSALAAPGMLLPFYQQFRWNYVANRFGADAMASYALADKAVYLTWTFVAIGFLSAIVWPALLLERRDGWILGSLPVRSRSIILGKLGALAAYIGLVSAGMHAGASVLFGSFLGNAWPAMLRGMAAHFIAAFGLSLFTFMGVTAVAATTVALAGPRHFARVSSILQLALVAIVTSTLLLLPALAAAAPALAGGVPAGAAWILELPPIWFLGIDDMLNAGDNPVMRDLAGRATMALFAAIAITAGTFPLAGIRAMRAVAGPVGGAPRGLTRFLSRWLAGTLGGTLAARGAVQFALATFGRVNGHRLVMTMAFGLALVVVVPVALVWMPREFASPTNRPSVALLAAPLVLIYFGLAGIRIAMALPSTLPARWVFAAAPAPMLFGREGARGLLLGLGVAPAVISGAIMWSAVWNPLVALPHVITTSLAGWLLAEIHLWGFVGPPCVQPLPPGSGNLQARWPLYFLGLLIFCVQLPYAEAAAASSPALLISMIAVLVVALVLFRRAGEQAAWVAAVTGDPRGLLMLDLSAPLRKGARVPQADYARVARPEERPPHA